MRVLIGESVLVLFTATCVAAAVAWVFVVYNGLRLLFLARKMKLEGLLRLNPLNVIFYPELLSSEGLEIRRKIFRSLRWFAGLIAFGFFLGGVAYVLGPILT